jgi:hypothetical protein
LLRPRHYRRAETRRATLNGGLIEDQLIAAFSFRSVDQKQTLPGMLMALAFLFAAMILS